jgi:hypothetical protein
MGRKGDAHFDVAGYKAYAVLHTRRLASSHCCVYTLNYCAYSPAIVCRPLADTGQYQNKNKKNLNEVAAYFS